MSGFDRFGEPYTTKDALGNFGSVGRILVGPTSRTGLPRVWVYDDGVLDYEYKPVLTPTGNFDPWKSVKDAAHAKGLDGYWGGPKNDWHFFSYFQVKNNQVKPGFFLIERENKINPKELSDAFNTVGDGRQVVSGVPFYWIPDSSKSYDPTSGEYYDKNGVRRYNNGVVWIPSRNKENFSDVGWYGVAAFAALAAPAVIGAFGAEAGAGAVSSGVVVGGGVAPAAEITATTLAADAGLVAAGTGAAAVATGSGIAGTAVAGSAISTFLDESVDFVVDTGKDIFKGAITGAIIENSMDDIETLPALKQKPSIDYVVSPDVNNSTSQNNNKELLAGFSAAGLGLLLLFV